MSQNTSGIEPVGRAVLVKPMDPTPKSQMIEMPDNVKQLELMREQRAVVVEIGPFAWEGEPEPRAKVGQKVLVSAMSGYLSKGPADGEYYRVVNGRDIFARFKEPGNE